MKINNRRYLGNKYKLLSFITDTVKENCKGINSVFDVFAGTGAVASAFTDKHLIVNDILYSNHLAHLCWFSNEKYDENKIRKEIDRYNKSKPTKENYMSQNFSNTFFSHKIALKIGYIREDIENKYKNKKINNKERAMLITSLLYAADKIANTCGHYDAYRIGAEYNDNFIMEYPEQFKNLKDNECYCMDSNDLAKEITCDLAYLDPPYNSRQYSDAYHLLENIARWEKPAVVGVAKKMDRSKLKSNYCTSKATATFEDLINKLNCKYILLSYNNTAKNANDRSNAKINDKDIIRILSKRGKVKVFSQNYKAFTTGKSKNDNNQERLFLCAIDNNKYSKKEYIQSPLNYTGSKNKLLPQILPLFPQNINTFVDLFCGGCNVGLNVKANKHVYNDVNKELINLYKELISSNYDDINKVLNRLITKYRLSNTDKNGYEFYGANSSDGVANYNKESYIKLKHDYNLDKDIYKLFLLIIYGFNNQIRFNNKSEFNLPVGKRDYNSKIKSKLDAFLSQLAQQKVIFMNNDFRNIKLNLKENDFIYADPPYLITTATYNENNGWTEQDEKDLLNYLCELDKKHIKFALSNVLTHKGKTNRILTDWIKRNNFKCIHLKKSYNNSNYHNKNTNKVTDEVLIINY